MPFSTIAEAIARIGELQPELGFTFQDMKGEETLHRFPEIERETARRAGRLQQLGLRAGDRAALVLVQPEDFVLTFLAAIRVGVIPVPMYPPATMKSLDTYCANTSRILSSSEARVLIASDDLVEHIDRLRVEVDTLETVHPVSELAGEATPTYPDITPDDIAFLQYTSGSTSAPKGVMVTHRSLVANAAGIMDHALEMVPGRDVGVSWLPLYHDMGLIGFVTSPLCQGIPVVFIPTMRFLRRPSVWLDTMHRHRGTTSFAPNFAYGLVSRRVNPADLERWDLSCVRTLGCGAEPINPETMRAFTAIYSEGCGLPKTAITPAYGMAEATLAIAIKTTRTPMRTRLIDADVFDEEGEARVAEGDARVVEHVACGGAFPGHALRIVCPDTGRVLPEGQQGEICSRGPSTTPGYFQNAEATAASWRDGWLHTGDLGYLHDGEVYVTGRLKDLIILNGRNVHPQAIEWEVGQIKGVRDGNVVSFSVPGPAREQLVVSLETRRATHELVEQVRNRIKQELGLVVDEVVLLQARALTKTSSGKLQRRKTRQAYLDGTLAVHPVETLA